MKAIKSFMVNGYIMTEIVHETKDIEKQLLDPNCSYEKVVALKMDLPKHRKKRVKVDNGQISFLKGESNGK